MNPLGANDSLQAYISDAAAGTDTFTFTNRVTTAERTQACMEEGRWESRRGDWFEHRR